MIRSFFLRIAKQAVEEFLTPQFDALRAEMNAQVGALRADMDALRGHMDAQVDSLRADMDGLRADMDAQFKTLRGDMDKRFEMVDKRFEMVEKRLDKIQGELVSHSEQLARLEQRVLDLKEILDIEGRLARLEANAGLGKA